jgi:hypothetical protein
VLPRIGRDAHSSGHVFGPHERRRCVEQLGQAGIGLEIRGRFVRQLRCATA